MHRAPSNALFGTLVLVLLGAPAPAFAQSQGEKEVKPFQEHLSALYRDVRFAEALNVSEQWPEAAAKSEGQNPGTATATALSDVAWHALFAKRPGRALAASERAMAAYSAHKGETLPDDSKWEDIILKDFADFRSHRLDYRRLHGVKGALAAAPESPEVLNQSALNLAEAGNYAEAVPLAERYLATALDSLASRYRDQGRYAEAEPLSRRALAIRERAFGPEHLLTLISVNNLAHLYVAQERYAEAEALYKRALEARERMLGKEHPDTLASVANLAALYRAQGRDSEAGPLFKRALEAYDRASAERQLADFENSSASALQPSYLASSTVQSVASAIRGVSNNEIRFGISAPLSGPSKDLGQQMRLGIETAFRQVNDEGGVNGRMLRLVAADDGYEPARTTETMKQLFDKDQVFGFIGNVGTPTAMVSAPFALDHRMLFFGAFTGASVLRPDPPDRYVFNYRASYAEETDAAVRYLVKIRRLKPDQMAVFAQQDSYGDAGFAGVAKAMRALRGGDGGFILRIGYSRNTIDVDAAIAQLKAHKTPIKAVVMIATYGAAAKFIEMTHSTYPGLIYTNVSFVGSTSLRDELMLLGPQFMAGVIVTQVVPAVDDYSSLVLQYKAALSKYSGEAPDYVSLEGYVAAQILIEALRRAGPQPDTEKVVDALESMRGFDLGLGTTVSYGRSEHQGSHKVWGTQLTEGGKYEAIELQ